jgi:uncharacterized membrane protein
MKLWEVHPAIVHFPLAFLLAGTALDAIALKKRRESLTRTAAGLYVAGVVSALPAIAAGVAAWLTFPHSEAVHTLMYWHPALAIAAVLLFAWVARMRWRNRTHVARPFQSILSLVASMALIAAGYLGGVIVYRGFEADSEHEHDARPPSAEDVLKEK